jgi:LemA protein
MMSSLFFWSLMGVVFFWAIGAYNRLVRLRAQVSQAFATLDAQLIRQLVWVQGCLPASMRDGARALPGEPADPVVAAWASLGSASDEFTTTLAAARARPLDAPAVAALTAAQGVLDMAWLRAWHQAHALVPASLPEDLPEQRDKLLSRIGPLRDAFNDAVRVYNEAIDQFPALLLARLFAFKPAGLMAPLAPPT